MGQAAWIDCSLAEWPIELINIKAVPRGGSCEGTALLTNASRWTVNPESSRNPMWPPAVTAEF